MNTPSVDLRLGDCLFLLKDIPGESVDTIITDPPYGIAYQSAKRIDKRTWKPKIANDHKPFIWFLYDAFRVTKSGGGILCFCEWRFQDIFRMAIECAGYMVKSQVIWDREWHGMGDLNGQFAPQHDIIWFATKGKFAFESNRPKSIIRAKRVSAESLVHPTEKPVELLEQLVCSIAPCGGTVLDPFMGSGSTGIASVKNDRNFIGFEIDKNYFEIAQSRIHNVLKDTPSILQPYSSHTPTNSGIQTIQLGLTHL